jgi:hypothetical protein
MTDTVIEINSLRLSKLFGGGNGSGGSEPAPSSSHPEWLYNVSTAFGQHAPFNNLKEAITYLTQNTQEKDRVSGQYITFAEGTSNNWVAYQYTSSDLGNYAYQTEENWVEAGGSKEDPYTDIQEIIGGEGGDEPTPTPTPEIKTYIYAGTIEEIDNVSLADLNIIALYDTAKPYSFDCSDGKYIVIGVIATDINKINITYNNFTITPYELKTEELNGVEYILAQVGRKQTASDVKLQMSYGG